MRSSRVTKSFLYALIASVCLGAILGMRAVLVGHFGWFEARILLTTATVAGASLSGLACGAYWSTGRDRLLPLTGLVLTAWGSVMFVAGTWREGESEGFWRLAASVSIYAVACGHLSLLFMARLAPRFRWALGVAVAAVFGSASLLVWLVLGDVNDGWIYRALGAALIVDTGINLIIPILHKLSKAEMLAENALAPDAMRASIDREIAELRARIAELERKKQSGL